MSRLTDSAKKSLELKKIESLEGREHIDIASVEFRGLPIAVEGVEFYTKDNKDKVYYLFTIDDIQYYFATGAVKLVQVAQDWLELCEGDITSLNEELNLNPVNMKILKGRNEKTGNVFYTAEVIGDWKWE